MKLYLVQHAKSKPKEDDPRRSLSPEGYEDIKRIAGFAQQYLSINIQQIIHSTKPRAKQTAEVLARHLNPIQGLQEDENLEPLTAPEIWRTRIHEMKKNVLIVGHLPHLSKLTSLLLGKIDYKIISFKMGGILCLEKENMDWVIRWKIDPDMVP